MVCLPARSFSDAPPSVAENIFCCWGFGQATEFLTHRHAVSPSPGLNWSLDQALDVFFAEGNSFGAAPQEQLDAKSLVSFWSLASCKYYMEFTHTVGAFFAQRRRDCMHPEALPQIALKYFSPASKMVECSETEELTELLPNYPVCPHVMEFTPCLGKIAGVARQNFSMSFCRMTGPCMPKIWASQEAGCVLQEVRFHRGCCF